MYILADMKNIIISWSIFQTYCCVLRLILSMAYLLAQKNWGSKPNAIGFVGWAYELNKTDLKVVWNMPFFVQLAMFYIRTGCPCCYTSIGCVRKNPCASKREAMFFLNLSYTNKINACRRIICFGDSRTARTENEEAGRVSPQCNVQWNKCKLDTADFHDFKFN